MTQKHTPGPWICTDDGYVTAGEKYVHEPNTFGREIVPGAVIPAEVLANARFIVQACNSFDELLALIQRAIPYMKVVSRNDINAYSENNPDLYEEMQAIAAKLGVANDR